jgi:hypothetical protein
MVIVAVPVSSAAGVMVTVRLTHEPPKLMVVVETSVRLDDAIERRWLHRCLVIWGLAFW